MSIEEEKTKNLEQEQEQDQELIKDSKLSSKDDSINKKMQEMYAQHKKEAQTNQRPQSKYHRDRLQSGKKDVEQKKSEPQEIDENTLIQKINEHFEKRQITKKEFSDNQNVFLPLDEFFELFKNIHLDLKEDEINYLFNNKNPNKDDGYIYFNTFLDNYDFKFYPGESTLINKSNTDNQSNHSNYTSLLLNKPDKITPAIQNEFTIFKNDILNIVEESKNPPQSKKRLPPLKKENQPGQQRPSSRKLSQVRPSSRKEEGKTSLLEKELSKTQTKDLVKRKPQSAYKTTSYSKTGVPATQKKPKVNYLKQTLQRMQLEDEMIKLTIDKRDKEFQRDCVKKMVLANEYAEKLGKPESYSAFSEEGESAIICRVFSKTDKDYKDINLKQFLLEFKKLEKMINQQKEREKYKDNKDKEMYERRGKEEDFFKMDRSDKHKIIKKILKESIQLKLQLKKQLKALRDKTLIDLDTLNKNLKLTNLDDDAIL